MRLSDYDPAFTERASWNSRVVVGPKRPPKPRDVILLGHSKIANTVRHLGVDIDDALILAERTEI